MEFIFVSISTKDLPDKFPQLIRTPVVFDSTLLISYLGVRKVTLVSVKRLYSCIMGSPWVTYHAGVYE